MSPKGAAGGRLSDQRHVQFPQRADGLAERPVHLETRLEAMLGKPVVGHDTALYWAMFRTLGLAPTTQQGRLLSSLAG